MFDVCPFICVCVCVCIFPFLDFYFVYLLLAALGLHCCAGLSLVTASRVVRGLLIVVASLCCGAQAIGEWASVVVAHGLNSCGSWALEHRLSSCGAQA